MVCFYYIISFQRFLLPFVQNVFCGVIEKKADIISRITTEWRLKQHKVESFISETFENTLQSHWNCKLLDVYIMKYDKHVIDGELFEKVRNTTVVTFFTCPWYHFCDKVKNIFVAKLWVYKIVCFDTMVIWSLWNKDKRDIWENLLKVLYFLYQRKKIDQPVCTWSKIGGLYIYKVMILCLVLSLILTLLCAMAHWVKSPIWKKWTTCLSSGIPHHTRSIQKSTSCSFALCSTL